MMFHTGLHKMQGMMLPELIQFDWEAMNWHYLRPMFDFRMSRLDIACQQVCLRKLNGSRSIGCEY
jgi:hypothetical protein